MFCYNPLVLLLITQLLGDALSSNSVKPRSKRGLHHHTSKLSIKDLALELLLKTVADEQSEFEKAKKNVHILQRDSCTNIRSVGQPVTHNTRYHTYGAWMKDPLGVMGFETVFSMDNYEANVLHEFANMDMFKAGVARKRYSLPYTCDGTGAVVYGPYLYFNRANTHYIAKYNLQTQRVDAQIPVSGYQPRKNHYSWGGYSGMDLAVDEQGLWVLWGSTSNSYRLHASKIDLYQNTIIQTWSLNTETMSSMGNAFVTCGVIYAINSYDNKITTINFAYDTKTSKEWNPNIQFTNQYGSNSMVDYNPREKVLYAWDNKRQVTYPITFENQ